MPPVLKAPGVGPLPEPAEFAVPKYDSHFVGPSQATRLKAAIQVIVAGKDVTNRLEPYLINVHVIDGVKGRECHIELDDRDHRLPLPPLGAQCIVMMGWTHELIVSVFNGYINDVEHGFGREQGGRRMWVHAYGADYITTNIKEPFTQSSGEGAPAGQQEGTKIPLSEPLNKAAKSAKATMKIHPAFANIMRDSFMQMNASFIQYGEQIANEHGGYFRVVDGNVGELTRKGQRADGSNTPVIKAYWGDNLIGWRVHIYSGRTNWKGGKQAVYNVAKAAWTMLKKIGNAPKPFGGASNFQMPGPAPNESVGNQHNDGSNETAESAYGEGRIVINGEPRAEANCHVALRGARPGVDGYWTALTVEHIYSRQGYVTWLDVVPEFHSDSQIGNVADGLYTWPDTYYDTRYPDIYLTSGEVEDEPPPYPDNTV